MRALTIDREGSPSIREVPEPEADEGPILVQTAAIGICGTDHAILKGHHGGLPPGEDFLVLGHESLGRVREAPTGSGLERGDTVVGIVRMPDPEPCSACRREEWDMCRNGDYTEHGIKQRHGFGRERFRVDATHVVRLGDALAQSGVLVEPASIVAKAWEQIWWIGRRAHFDPQQVLITGAGPLGMLAALMARQHELQVVLFDRVESGAKPRLAARLGARYETDLESALDPAPDIVLECTGAPDVVERVVGRTRPAGLICLTGVSEGDGRRVVDVSRVDRALVFDNQVVFGSVNANRRHYIAAAEALSKADPAWLNGMITRRFPLSRYSEALGAASDEDIKTVVSFEV